MPSDRHIRVVLDAAGDAGDARPEPDRPFNILIMGDFRGSPEDGARTAAPADRRPVAVDRDDIDAVLRRFRPGVRFRLGGEDGRTIDMRFEEMDDFHPDRLLERVPLLGSLDALRQDARAGRVVAPPGEATAARERSPGPARSGSLLDQIIDEGPGVVPVRPSAPPPSDLQGYIRSILAPHVVAEADPRQTGLAAAIEDTMASVLRALLHHPEFQALESNWRGVSLLVHGLETDARLRVFVLNVTRAELDADLAGDAALHRVLAGGADAAGSRGPWALTVGLYSFDDSVDDAALLGRIAAMAERSRVPFVAAAAPALAGLASFAEEPEPGDVMATSAPEWLALRGSAAAAYVGLVLPRFVLRAPYDPREEPCERIALDEMTSPPAHEDYLWGNGGIICALVLGRAFSGTGWQMQVQDPVVDGLPLHLYRVDGETFAKPCAETLLTDRVADAIMDAGPMVLLSMKNGGAVRLTRLQSIADPPVRLAGAWTRTG